MSKNGAQIRNKGPSNLFHETDMYTFDIEGRRDLTIEASLSILEGEFSRVRREVVKPGRELSDHDRLVLCAFTAGMHSRTLAARESRKPFWDEVAGKSRRMAQWAENEANPPPPLFAQIDEGDLNRSNIMTLHEIEALANDPITSLVPSYIETLPHLLFQIDMAIVKTSTSPGFITSDGPCVWIDPYLSARSFPRGPALMSPSIEIHLPISPKSCIFFNRRGDSGYIRLADYGPLVDTSVVPEANWRMRKKSREYIVVDRNIVLWDWFVYSQA